MIAANLLRAGIVSAVVPERASVVVAFQDKDNLVSKELPMLFAGTLHAKHYTLPTVDESVLCAFLGNGMEVGFCLGSFYTDVDKPPTDSVQKKGIWFDDGSYVEYDSGTGVITVDAKGGVVLRAATVTIDGDLTVTGHIRGDLV